jgi:hypothetical protein
MTMRPPPRMDYGSMASGGAVLLVRHCNQLQTFVAVCLGSELTCKRRADTCGRGIGGLDRRSCCSELWIRHDLPSFTNRHTTMPNP